METGSGHDCRCWRLTEPLVDDLELAGIDHVCFQTMIGTIDPAERDGILPSPPADDTWPVTVGRRELGFVLRQWAQGDPSERLARQLNDRRDWGRTVRSTEGLVRRAVFADDARGDRFIARSLRQRGLPDTPATVRHLRAVMNGDTEPLPALGLQVVTRVYIKIIRLPDWTQPIGRADPPHDVAVVGPLDFATGPVMDRAKRVVLSHKDWLSRWGRHPIGGLREIRRHQPGAFARTGGRGNRPPGFHDYAAEARLRRDELLELATGHLQGDEGAITQFLTLVYRQVHARRKRDGMPEVQTTWRKDLRPELRQFLRESRRESRM